MLEGIYAVTFESNQQRVGSGIAVFTPDNKVGGGDDSYFYRGTLQVSNNNSVIAGEIVVKHYQGLNNGIFPGINEYTLKLSGGTGLTSAGTMVLTGSVEQFPDMKIAIQCKRISDL